MITVKYTSIDGYRKTRSFKTISGARKFAQERVGKNPEIGGYYAVSADGVGKITAIGIKVADLFGDADSNEFKIYIVHGSDRYYTTEAEAKEAVRALREDDPGEVYGPYGIEERTVTNADFSPPRKDPA